MPWELRVALRYLTARRKQAFISLISGVAVLGVAVGVAALFIETHETPETAPSDGPNMVPLKEMPALLARLQAFDRIAKAV